MTETGPEKSATPLVRRQRIVLSVATLCAILSSVGLAASLLVKSPQQVLADSAAPPPSHLTAVVERRVLAATVVTRGTAVASSTIEVTPVVADAGAQVVTAVRVKAGDEVNAGQVLVAVSGRPLIVLPGALPAYRNLKPADRGADIRQLQQALKSLGYSTAGDEAGYFGAQTKAAVRKLYADRGYDPPDTGGPDGRTDKNALKGATAAVQAAQLAVDAMKRRIAAGESAKPPEEPLPDQLTRLRAALDDAKKAQAELIASTGTMLPLAEFVFVPELPARVTAFSAKVGDKVEPPLITLSAGRLAVRVKLRPDQAGLVKAGMPAKLVSETLGQDAEGTVTNVGPVTTDTEQSQSATGQAAGSGTPYQPVTVTPAKDLPGQWTGLDVRVTVTSAQTASPVLVVPLSAVSAGADGRTTVSVLGTNDQVSRVEIRAGVSGDGFVEITPIGGELSEGDRVVVSAS